ncbi:MAG TPA: UDP-N-acetylglucosamine 2-epimerase (non-hydrolyzing) [Patescibacteria group bacterium]|nr:UDP-N-acetylglucosamine 2-epimerase (non-hydrolyzing) [Patescibacteria group bacterium]
MKLVTIIGARPQFVKAAVVSRALKAQNAKNNIKIAEVLVHTGQHYDANMSDVFFEEMSIPQPDYHLGVGGQSHGTATGRMLEKIEQVLMSEKPDAVLVYGDTNSTLAGALAAVKLHIPVAHVEAGLRSYNMKMPEEINRILTDRISKWLFCPTDVAVNNLANEGYLRENKTVQHVSNVGDVMYDAMLYYKTIAKPTENIGNLMGKMKDGFYLATIHRAENTDNSGRLHAIVNALETIAKTKPVLLPIHPRTQKILSENDINLQHVTLLDPVGYFDMIILLENCDGVFTDSGGLQKEAFFSNKPCVTLRDETEWSELVRHGYNQLAGADYEKILAIEKKLSERNMEFAKSLYGDGHAGEKIVLSLLDLVI